VLQNTLSAHSSPKSPFDIFTDWMKNVLVFIIERAGLDALAERDRMALYTYVKFERQPAIWIAFTASCRSGAFSWALQHLELT
jgi:hypothetical protein